LELQNDLGDQLYEPYRVNDASQKTKPNFNLSSLSIGKGREGRVASVDSSIEDSSDPDSGLDPHTRLLPLRWRGYAIPAEESMGAYDQPLDLLKGIKPSNKGCEVTNGMMTCTTPAGKTFTIPAPPGFVSFRPGDKDYHFYSYGIGPSGLSPNQLMRGIINAPTPGPKDHVKPATKDGVLNEAQPDWQVPYLNGLWDLSEPYWRDPVFNGGSDTNFNKPAYWSPVKTYLTTDQDGNPMVINVTEPGHPLFPGYVARYIVRTDSGFYIANEGEGLGPYQTPGAIAEGYINGIWKGQSRGIIKGLDSNIPSYTQSPLK
jgi:hypothetical protein